MPRSWKKLTAQGKSIILISSYLPEVMGLSDRLIVMAQGKSHRRICIGKN